MFQNHIPGSGAARGRQGDPETAALLDYVVNPEKRLVSVRFGRKVTALDIEKYAAWLRANPQFEPDFSEIADLSAVEELDLQADEFIRLADKVDPFSLQAKRAFVTRTAVQSHAARMHRILRTQRNFSIFRSLEDAEAWIAS